MTYKFKCDNCDEEFYVKRRLADRDIPAVCHNCLSNAKRVFTAQIQIISDRLADRPENKYALGFDESTRLATMKADDEAYNRDYKTDWKPNRNIPTLSDTYQKMFGG